MSASGNALREPLAAFDDKAQAWDDYTNTPLGRLRQELTTHHLMQHIGSRPRAERVLDVGGGTGSYAIPLARLGHRVCLLDFSAHMLDIARQKAEQSAPSLLERMSFCHASAQQVADLFPSDHFDLVMCHTLLEYVSLPWDILQAMVTVLRPGGLLSLLVANPHADPLRWAIARGDLEKAHLALTEQVSTADLFGLPRRTFETQAVQKAMDQAGVEVVAAYGIRAFADYLPRERLADPEFYARLFALETAAGALAPYRQIARYNQFLGQKARG